MSKLRSCRRRCAPGRRRGSSQAELARWLGTTLSVVARLEGGRVSMSFATLRRYAEATGTQATVSLVRDDSQDTRLGAPALIESPMCRELSMPRKNEGLLFELSLLPWWVSATIAAVAFVGIVYVFPSMSIESPLWAVLVPLQSKASYIGIAVAMLFLLTAVLSFSERRRKKRLLDRQRNLDSIRELPWRRFEELVAEAFRRDGYAVIENVGAGADGGVDIRLRRDGESYLVQCKNWRKQRVGVATVREMFGVLVAESAREVFVVCSGKFTADAVRFAKGKPINLVDGDTLMEMVARVRRDESNAAHASSAHREPLDAQARGQEPDGSESMHAGAPSCPRCGGNLVVRTARKGKNAGQRFWGCETFPKCRFVRDYGASTT